MYLIPDSSFFLIKTEYGYLLSKVEFSFKFYINKIISSEAAITWKKKISILKPQKNRLQSYQLSHKTQDNMANTQQEAW